MNPLVAKEIRLLLPAFGMALLLAVVPIWLLPGGPHRSPTAIAFYPFCFGTLMLALSSFGREFGLRTFPLLLAQPLERARIWWTKIAVLGLATGTVGGAWWLSCAIRVQRGSDDALWAAEFWVMSMAIVVVIFAGALWTTLLLRQVMAAFWITILAPAAIGATIAWNGGGDRMVYEALGLYAIAGFLWARRQFFRAQEVGWTGGVVTLSGQRSAKTAGGVSTRARRPLMALFAKELQLHQVGLAAMGGLFVLHLGIVMLRKAGPNAFGETIRVGLDCFSLLWLVVPLLVGSQSVAEERKLGTMDGLMGLPVPSRVQFGIKLLFVVVLGGLLSAALLWTTEGIGVVVGGRTPFGLVWKPFDRSELGNLLMIFIAICLIPFYASTLTHNIVQALALAVVTAILFATPTIVSQILLANGITLWRGNLVNFIGWPVLVGALSWLAYCNFRRLSQNWRLWSRNTLALGATLVLIIVSTAAVYHRAWELLTPLEPPHGPARLTGTRPVALHTASGYALAVLLPDGRLWVGRIMYQPGRRLMELGESTWFSGGTWTNLAGGFSEGSNWVDAAASHWDTVGIRADGTLWLKEKPLSRGKVMVPARRPESLVNFGNEPRWLRVVPDNRSRSFLLLKGDGTLWRWGTNKPKAYNQWPELRSFEPYRLGADSDWVAMVRAGSSIYLWKRDGQAWVLNPSTPKPKISEHELEPGIGVERWENLDQTRWRSLAQRGQFQAGVKDDGTLWLSIFSFGKPGRFRERTPQVGKGTNWAAVVIGSLYLGALDTDGSLWRWDLNYSQELQTWVVAEFPARLGKNSDWMAIGAGMDGVLSLAADGSLWVWLQQDDSSEHPMLGPTRKPSKVEDILGQQK